MFFCVVFCFVGFFLSPSLRVNSDAKMGRLCRLLVPLLALAFVSGVDSVGIERSGNQVIVTADDLVLETSPQSSVRLAALPVQVWFYAQPCMLCCCWQPTRHCGGPWIVAMPRVKRKKKEIES